MVQAVLTYGYLSSQPAKGKVVLQGGSKEVSIDDRHESDVHLSWTTFWGVHSQYFRRAHPIHQKYGRRQHV